MLLTYYSRFDSQPFVANVRGARVRIGRDRENDIVLDSPYIDPFAIELRRLEAGWEIHTLGRNGCEWMGRQLYPGDREAWDLQSPIALFPFVIQHHSEAESEAKRSRELSEHVHQLVRSVHLDLIQQLHMNGTAQTTPEDAEELLFVERAIESSAAHHGVTDVDNGELASDLAGACIRDAILNWLLERHQTGKESCLVEKAYWSQLATSISERERELKQLQLKMAKQLFTDESGTEFAERVESLEERFWEVYQHLRGKMSRAQQEYLALRQLKKEVKDSLFGFGPLEDLLRLPMVSEIMVNASDEIFIEKDGVLQHSGRRFVSNEVTLTVIERIVGRVDRRIDTAQPMVNARLSDGSRVNAVIPPLAVKGPCLTIRKFSRESFDLDRLVEIGSLTPQIQEFLTACVRAQRSILVSGGTGTGKTTLLNCLSQHVPASERIICIEDTHELQLDHPHVVFLECRDGNNEGRGGVTIRDLLKNALRQRPDRLIVGECRGKEALDMLQAMNTGHDGSMTTIHANTPADALRRLEVLVRESGLPADAIRRQVISAVDVVVQLTRQPNGKRVVTHVDEVVGISPRDQQIVTRPIFRPFRSSDSGELLMRPTGCIPSFVPELLRDQHIKLDLFLRGAGGTALTSN